MLGGIFANEFSGVILDEITHQPIIDVVVNSDTEVIYSNKHGRFEILTNSSEISLSKLGYKSESYKTNNTNFAIIYLTPIVLVSEEIVVTETKHNNQLDFHPLKPLTLHNVHINNSSTTTHIVGKLQGISIKSYGGPASVSTVSLHGGQGDRFSIMFDGVQINSEQNGNADISQIPSALIDEVHFYPQGSSARFGSSAITGVLNFAPPNEKLKYSYSTGTFGLKQHTLFIGKKFSNLTINASVGKYRFDGNYSYKEDGSYNQIPVFMDKIFTNIINKIDQQFYYLSINHKLQKGFSISTSVMAVDNNRINSENIYSSPDYSTMDDNFGFQSIKIERDSTKYSIIRKQNSLHFVSNHSFPVDATHKIETISQHLETTLGYNHFSIHHDNINSKSSNSIDTSKSVLAFLWEFDYTSHPFRIIFALRNDVEKNQNPVQVSELITEWNISKIIDKLSLSISRNYKRPNFNDLYWVPFGNLNLKTEFSRNIYLRSKFNLFHSNLNVSLYHISYENLIRWKPKNGGMWSPENISSALSYGYDINLDASQNPLFRFSVNFSHNVSKNYDKSLDSLHLGKPLMHTPKYIASFQHSSHYKGYSLSTNWKFTSERIRLYDLEDLMLPKYHTVDFSFGKSLYSKWFKFELQILLENVFNEQYQTVFGYPNPGRSISTKLTIEK